MLYEMRWLRVKATWLSSQKKAYWAVEWSISGQLEFTREHHRTKNYKSAAENIFNYSIENDDEPSQSVLAKKRKHI